jgi:ATP-dependent DNA ligase
VLTIASWLAFDLLELAGEDLRPLPWVKRTKLLRETSPCGERLRLIEPRPASQAVYDELVTLGLEDRCSFVTRSRLPYDGEHSLRE